MIVRTLAINILLTIVFIVSASALLIIFFVFKYHSGVLESRWPENAYRYNDLIGFEMTPGISGPMLDGTFYVKTHRLGYRIPEFRDVQALQPGGLLAVGCSFTFGDEVNAEETFVWHAGRQLGLDAYNYGVCSYSYASALLQLEELQRTGTLALLRPSAIILGAGAWMYARSLSPFFPTRGPQFAYSYITKNNGRLAISRPADIYSCRHLYELMSHYYAAASESGFITAAQFTLLFKNIHRILLAEWDKKQFEKKLAQPEVDISRDDLYDFVIGTLSRIARENAAVPIVLWMPHRRMTSNRIDEALVRSVERHDAVRLVNGIETLRKYEVPEDQYRHRHPGPKAHRAYAEEIVGLMRGGPQNALRTASPGTINP